MFREIFKEMIKDFKSELFKEDYSVTDKIIIKTNQDRIYSIYEEPLVLKGIDFIINTIISLLKDKDLKKIELLKEVLHELIFYEFCFIDKYNKKVYSLQEYKPVFEYNKFVRLESFYDSIDANKVRVISFKKLTTNYFYFFLEYRIKELVNTYNYLKNFINKYSKNNTRITSIVKIDDNFDEEFINTGIKLLEFIRNQEIQKGMIILPKNIEYDNILAELPQNIDKILIYFRREILVNLGIPPGLLYPEDSNRSSSKVNKEIFLNNTIKPYINLLELYLDFEFDKSDLDNIDNQELEIALKYNIIDREEARKLLGI